MFTVNVLGPARATVLSITAVALRLVFILIVMKEEEGGVVAADGRKGTRVADGERMSIGEDGLNMGTETVRRSDEKGEERVDIGRMDIKKEVGVEVGNRVRRVTLLFMPSPAEEE